MFVNRKSIIKDLESKMFVLYTSQYKIYITYDLNSQNLTVKKKNILMRKCVNDKKRHFI